jgi:hypothetical protein
MSPARTSLTPLLVGLLAISAEVSSTGNPGARVELKFLPGLLAVLAKLPVPSPRSVYGGPKRPVDFTSSSTDDVVAKLKIDPLVTFAVDAPNDQAKGSIAAAELAISDALRDQVQPMAKLASTSGLLFGGETKEDPPPAKHSVLHLGATAYMAAVGGDSIRSSFEVFGPRRNSKRRSAVRQAST